MEGISAVSRGDDANEIVVQQRVVADNENLVEKRKRMRAPGILSRFGGVHVADIKVEGPHRIRHGTGTKYHSFFVSAQTFRF